MYIFFVGVSQLCVAINKLDTVGWSETRFLEIATKLNTFLRQAGFREKDVTFVPCSGLTGENLASPPTEQALKQWYTGPTLLQVIGKQIICKISYINIVYFERMGFI